MSNPPPGALAADLTQPPILIVSDRAADAEDVARALGEEYAKVHVCTDDKRHVADFELLRPGVLVLAFTTLAKAERCRRALQQPAPLAKALPYRTLALCSADELREAYELCKSGEIDDFVSFWPRAEELRPLRMAVRRAMRQADAERSGLPGASEFATLARRLGALDTLRSHPTAENMVALQEAVNALHALAARCPPRVLVVDDDPFQHKVLAQILAQAEVTLEFAKSAGEALAALHRRRPDLVLMDVNLPDTGGVETTRLLKSAAGFAAIPVIMITGAGGREVVVESLKAGAADFVVKPVDKGILLGKVRRLLWGRAAA
jgi:PleD family two-component response regulator